MQGLTEKIKGIDATLLEMLLGMASCAVAAQVCICFAKDRAGLSAGLWIGVVTAAFMACNMNSTLERAFMLDPGQAQNLIRKHTLLRYAAAGMILAGVCLTGWINPFAAFGGIMTLKVSAYLQPITHKVIKKMRR